MKESHLEQKTIAHLSIMQLAQIRGGLASDYEDEFDDGELDAKKKGKKKKKKKQTPPVWIPKPTDNPIKIDGFYTGWPLE